MLLIGRIALSGGGWWVILVSAVGLSIAPWHMIWLAVRRYPPPATGWGLPVHVMRSFCISLIASGAAYLIGATMRSAP